MICEYLESTWSGNYCKLAKKYVSNGTYDSYCRYGDTKRCTLFQEATSSGGCYLTSACTLAKGRSDDCYELTILRAFRDNWLRNQPTGEDDIAEYYRVAPKIVEAINANANSLSIYENIYEKMIMPCIEFIENNEFNAAYSLYKRKTKELAITYLE